jgi:hypothetical protein
MVQACTTIGVMVYRTGVRMVRADCPLLKVGGNILQDMGEAGSLLCSIHHSIHNQHGLVTLWADGPPGRRVPRECVQPGAILVSLPDQGVC